MNTNDYKWLIQSDCTATLSAEENDIWNDIHKDYSKETFSLTQDPKVCNTLIHPCSQSPCFNIPNSPEIQVLIPGCGSEIYLQKTLMKLCPQIRQVCCTDFSEKAIEQAKKNWLESDGDAIINSQQLIFEEVDSTKIAEQKPDWKNKFDYVLVVNSVVSGDDVKNRQMLAEFYKVLKPGGQLYGFFPTIFFDLEVAYLSKEKAQSLADGTINLSASAWYDKKWNDRQIYYTPLRLNRIFKEVGFNRLNFEVFFGDSEILAANLKGIYGIDEQDIYSWLFLVRLEKEKV